MADPESVEEVFALIAREQDGIDVLVSNAGVSARFPFAEIPPAEWRRVMATNLDGAFFVAQAAAKHMLARGSGVILNTASTNGLVGYREHALYSAGKGALVELTLHGARSRSRDPRERGQPRLHPDPVDDRGRGAGREHPAATIRAAGRGGGALRLPSPPTTPPSSPAIPS